MIPQSRSDVGAAAVETVFVLALVLIPLLIGATEYGRALYTSIVLEEAAQEGASYMANTGDSAVNTETVVINSISYPSLTTANVEGASGDNQPTCTAVTRDISGGSASRVTVRVSYTLEALIIPTDFALVQHAEAEGTAPCP